MKDKKLYRVEEGKMLCGVCGGIGEFLGLDSTVIRLIFALCALTGWGILAYIICALVIPQSNTYNQ